MPSISIANLKKTIYYLQRNGLRNTWKAALERLEQGKGQPYLREILSQEELQREAQALQTMLEGDPEQAPTFSVLVPAYRTDPVFLKELVDSVSRQIYPLWELLILDASGDESVRNPLEEISRACGILLEVEEPGHPSSPVSATDAFRPGVIRYLALPCNGGISENTNAGIPMARGKYIGLLDHDDVLTPDALGKMAGEIMKRAKADSPWLLYSDEDKWDGAENYYEPHFKEDFNGELLLTNNYICHFLVMRRELFGELRLRKEYDGAQDYDLVLRATRSLRERGCDPSEGKGILHVKHVLYHWRCHRSSTAENPRSKSYAYEAGRRALQDWADTRGIKARALATQHVGFYHLQYQEEPGQSQVQALLQQRPEVAAVGGRIACTSSHLTTWENRKSLFPGDADTPKKVKKGGIIGGRMDREGNIYYYGLKKGYSGYMNRGALPQEAECLDLRCIAVAEKYHGVFRQVVGVPYVTQGDSPWFDVQTLPADVDLCASSLRLGEALGQAGGKLIWDPGFVKQVEG